MKVFKRYFVTYGFYVNGHYSLNSKEIQDYTEPDMSQGLRAQTIEKMLQDQLDDQSIVIINFWEL